MRILMATTSGWGRFGPMLPFGAACRRAGHEVMVAAPRSFAGAVARAGYRYWPCDDVADEDLAAIHERIRAATPEEGNRLTALIGADLAPRAILPRMVAAIDEWRPDVVLREAGEGGSLVAADLRGVPQVQVLVGLEKFTGMMLPVAGPLLSGVRESVGLPPDPGGERLLAVPSVTLLPASFEEPGGGGADAVRRYRDVRGAPTAAEPLPAEWWPGSGDAPLVYATFGTVAAAIPFAAAAFRTVLDAVAALPVRVLATIGDGGDASGYAGLPPNVRMERWVPQAAALHEAAAVISHGGMGTVLGALAAGVPQVVVPQFADHPDNAARVDALGAGLRVGVDGISGRVDPDGLRTATRRVLEDDAFVQGARRMAAEIGALPPADEILELFAALRAQR